MARRRVYIKPFIPAGNAYASFIEVTSDVNWTSLGTLQKKLDISDYDIGIYNNSAVNFSLKNITGKYSDVGETYSIFSFRRAGSIVRITWDLADWDFFAGISQVGEIQGGEIVVFEGFLNDDSTVMQLTSQEIDFQILGYESLFDQVVGPNFVSTPPADNKSSTLIKTILSTANAGAPVPVFTIDFTQIVPGNDVIFDDVSVFTNKTCKEQLNIILQASNSVLYLNGTTPIVSSRTPTATVQMHFYGQGSTQGPENIIDIQDVRNGINRTFNYLTWTNTTLFSQDATSIQLHGVRKKDLAVDGITNSTKQQSVLDNIRSEFANPKQEFLLVTPVNPTALALNLLSRVDIDYPVVAVNTDQFSQYGFAQYGVSKYPYTLATFQILQSDNYKVISMDTDLGSNKMTLTLRHV